MPRLNNNLNSNSTRMCCTRVVTASCRVTQSASSTVVNQAEMGATEASILCGGKLGTGKECSIAATSTLSSRPIRAPRQSNQRQTKSRKCKRIRKTATKGVRFQPEVLHDLLVAVKHYLFHLTVSRTQKNNQRAQGHGRFRACHHVIQIAVLSAKILSSSSSFLCYSSVVGLSWIVFRNSVSLRAFSERHSTERILLNTEILFSERRLPCAAGLSWSSI